MELSPDAMRALEQRLDVARASAGDLDRQQERSRRRSQGAFFTPLPLVRFVCEWALASVEAQQPLRWREDGSPEIEIVDPSAGDGRFLVAMRELLVARAVKRGVDPKVAGASITARCLRGVELDSEFAEACRAALGAEAVVEEGEALLSSSLRAESVDLVVGNPPYLKSANLEREQPELRRALQGELRATEAGEWDLYGAFIERAAQWLRPGGRVAFVVPSRWWTGRWAKELRAHLASQELVLALVDFGDLQLFDGATVYSSLCLLGRETGREVQMARRGARGWECGELERGTLGAAPWSLSVGHARTLISRLSEGATLLGERVRIGKGTGTNADRVFVDPPVEVEDSLLVPVYRGRDIGAASIDAEHRLLFPYDENGGLIAPEKMRRDYPLSYAYLESRRAELEGREGGRYAGPTFYRFGRPQNLLFLRATEAKVVIPDVGRGGRALIDRSGAMVLDSAYALRPEDRSELSVEFLCALLRSPLVDFWLSENGLRLRGGYRRMKTAYLESMPLPRALGPELARDIDQAMQREPVDDEVVNELLRRSYGLSTEDWEYLCP